MGELEEMGIEYKLDTMVLELTEDKVVKAINTSDGLMIIEAKAVILSMGCRERTRGAIAIPGMRPAGVFTAGTAQRYINMEGYMVGKKVVILGSGDIGLIMARRMVLEGAEVLAVAELMPYSGGLTRNIVQCLDDYDIPLMLSHTVTEIKGKDRVESVTISQVDDSLRPIPGTEKEYECDTVLLSVGLIPENELSSGAGVELDPVTKGPVVNEAMETSIAGVFACGNVVHVHDLVDFVTEESRRAGTAAAKYVAGLVEEGGSQFTTEAAEGVAYTVPQQVRLANVEDSLNVFLRVRKVYHNASLVVKADGKEIMRKKRRHMAPGEMENIRIPKDKMLDMDGRTVTIEVEETPEKEVKSA